MDIQTLFYVVAISFMVLFMIVMGVVGLLAWRLKQALRSIPTLSGAIATGLAAAKKKEFLSTAGFTAFTIILAKLNEKFSSKRS
ncbi:MAG: hypothetical protein H6774_02000 [Pseudomonadales bacterium]|nr:hypothetical protein [Candidatus Woesebacteria bacterium]MCB9801839.1 hypothetical protein [Pseudomonadales bacterium]